MNKQALEKHLLFKKALLVENDKQVLILKLTGE